MNIRLDVSVNDKYTPNRKINAKEAVGCESGKVKRLRRLLGKNLPFGRDSVLLLYRQCSERVFFPAKPCLPPSPSAKEAMLFLFASFRFFVSLFRGYIYEC